MWGYSTAGGSDWRKPRFNKAIEYIEVVYDDISQLCNCIKLKNCIKMLKVIEEYDQDWK
jgi:hypothetical protein